MRSSWAQPSQACAPAAAYDTTYDHPSPSHHGSVVPAEAKNNIWSPWSQPIWVCVSAKVYGPSLHCSDSKSGFTSAPRAKPSRISSLEDLTQPGPSAWCLRSSRSKVSCPLEYPRRLSRWPSGWVLSGPRLRVPRKLLSPGAFLTILQGVLWGRGPHCSQPQSPHYLWMCPKSLALRCFPWGLGNLGLGLSGLEGLVVMAA